MVMLSKDGPRKHDFAGIRSGDANSKFDYSIFNGCFGGNIRPTDIDFSVDRNGKILIGEFKGISGSVPTGQRIHLETLAAKEDITVFVATGHPPCDVCNWWEVRGKKDWVEGGSDLESLRSFIKAWYDKADTR